MKSEKEIREMFEKLKKIEIVTHPSVIIFGRWIFGEGDKKELKFWEQMIDGIVDAEKRRVEPKS